MNRHHRFKQAAAALIFGASLLACNFSQYASIKTLTPTLPAAESTPVQAVDTPNHPTPPLPVTPAVDETQLPVEGGGSFSVAYTKAERLWLWRNGQARQVATQGSVFKPRLSPDGRLAAFLRPFDTFHTELWVVDLESGDERRLVSVADLDEIGGGVRDPAAVAVTPFAFAWVGQSRTLAFNTQQVFNGPGLNLLDDAHLVDADSGQISHLFLSGWGGMFAFSPDGKYVALSKTDALLLSKRDGSDYRKVMDYPSVTTYSEYRYYVDPHWSNNGDALRLALPPADPLAQPAAPTTLWQISLEGGAQQVGRINAVPFFEQPVVYSPDLARIAYLRPGENDQRQVVIATYDGQGELVVAGGVNVRLFGWSPDGKKLAYSLGELQEAWVGGVDGAPQPLGGAQFGLQDLRWVDDQRLVVIQQQGVDYRLVLVDLKGGQMELDSFAEPPIYWDVKP
jgi:hypothetical protein